MVEGGMKGMRNPQKPLCRGYIWAETCMMRSGQRIPGRQLRECREHEAVKVWVWYGQKESSLAGEDMRK